MKRDADIARERFDRAAAGWDENPTRRALASEVAAAIRRQVGLDPEMQVLDFGAGTGLLTLALLPDVAAITAVDASGAMLEVLAGKLGALGVTSVSTRHCDIGREPLPESAYSLVVSSMVLHHIADIPATLAILRRCLKPSGRIALADLDREDGSFHPDPSGVFHNGFEREEVRRWVEEAGFHEVAITEATRIRRPSREYPVFLVTGQRGA